MSLIPTPILSLSYTLPFLVSGNLVGNSDDLPRGSVFLPRTEIFPLFFLKQHNPQRNLKNSLQVSFKGERSYQSRIDYIITFLILPTVYFFQIRVTIICQYRVTYRYVLNSIKSLKYSISFIIYSRYFKKGTIFFNVSQ